MSKPTVYNDHKYGLRVARLKRQAMRDSTPCWICQRPFDWSLDYRSADSFTADHVLPLSRGGLLTGEIKPAHRGCNARRGDGTKVRAGTKLRPPANPDYPVLEDGFEPCPHHRVGDPSRGSCPHSRAW